MPHPGEALQSTKRKGPPAVLRTPPAKRHDLAASDYPAHMPPEPTMDRACSNSAGDASPGVASKGGSCTRSPIAHSSNSLPVLPDAHDAVNESSDDGLSDGYAWADSVAA